MVGLSLNLVLECAALVATWSRGLQWLRAFLLYELIIDVLGMIVPNVGFVPWYYYWGARTIELFLLLNLGSSTGRAILRIWRLLSCLTFILVAVGFWAGTLTTKRAEEFTAVGAMILLSLVLLEFVLKPKEWIIWLGQSLWVVALIVPLKGYPFATLLPLMVWSMCLLGRRDTVQVEDKGLWKKVRWRDWPYWKERSSSIGSNASLVRVESQPLRMVSKK